MPKSVTKVGKQAFENCAKLKTITVKSKKTKFLKNAFKKVPKSSKIKLPKMTSKEKKSFKKMLKKAGFKGKVK
ncbi:MAG: leucine-rich repeat protein [Eubacterium sp.]|nr:leucine-rich repeat protein [Eubacterium sp.]